MEIEYNQEIKDLKERLLMGQEEYKSKFIECQKLQRELRKSKRTSVSSGSSVEKEVLQTSASSSSQTTPAKDNMKEGKVILYFQFNAQVIFNFKYCSILKPRSSLSLKKRFCYMVYIVFA